MKKEEKKPEPRRNARPTPAQRRLTRGMGWALVGLAASLVPVTSQLFPWQLQYLRKDAAKESCRGPGYLRWRPAGQGAAGLAVARQPVLPREPPSTPTLRDSLSALHRSPAPFFHLPQKPPLLASALTRAQLHQPWGAGTAPRTAPSGIALGDFSSAAVAVAAAMVARAAQNANYSLGHATGSVGGARGRGCGLYSIQESVPRVAE